MTVVITGRSGFVARFLIDKLSFCVDDLVATSSMRAADVLYLDLKKPEDFNYTAINDGDLIIHLAAISSPDLCEKEYEMAYNINVVGTKYFLSKCLERGAKILFFSSDAVYGESLNSDFVFDEGSKCKPVGKYGEMKLVLENEFKNFPQFKVFRLSYVFSKFDKFTSYLTKCVEKDQEAEVFSPFCRNVVFLGDVIDAVKSVVDNFDRAAKVTNICGDRVLCRKDLAEMYTKIVDERLKFRLSDPGEEFFKTRSRNIFVKSLFLKNLLRRPVTDIEKAMKLEFNINI